MWTFSDTIQPYPSQESVKKFDSDSDNNQGHILKYQVFPKKHICINAITNLYSMYAEMCTRKISLVQRL